MSLFAGIRRNNKFSPNHIGNDGAIFEHTAKYLRNLGHDVNEYTEETCLSGIEEQFVFSMARDPKVARMLQKKEDQGAVVINSGYGTENCYRSAMTNLLNNAGILVPANLTVNTCDPLPVYFQFVGEQNIWIKRGDFHAIHKEDVSFVRNAEEGCEMLREYARRGIETAVLSEHIVGDLVKFYGVLDTDFFHWFYPTESGHSKFGNESLNGKILNTEFQINVLQDIANQAAQLLKIDIYGGDAIVTPDGLIYLIDMNDWPSFAPCREQAAMVIAKRIHDKTIAIDRCMVS